MDNDKRQDVPGGHIHRINIVAINQGVELRGGRRSFISSRWEQRDLLTFLELLKVQDGLGVQTHAGQCLNTCGSDINYKSCRGARQKTERCDEPLPRLASTLKGTLNNLSVIS